MSKTVLIVQGLVVMGEVAEVNEVEPALTEQAALTEDAVVLKNVQIFREGGVTEVAVLVVPKEEIGAYGVGADVKIEAGLNPVVALAALRATAQRGKR